MRIYAVLDLKGGQVVRGVAGQRDRYRPIVSHLVQSSSPGDVARAFVNSYAIKDAYVADLDAIAGSAPDLAALTAIADSGMQIIVDAGVATPRQAQVLVDFQCRGVCLSGIIVGLESSVEHEEWSALVKRIGSERAVFSLDLKNGQPISSQASLAHATPPEIAELAWRAGFRRLIALDLHGVGSGRGVSTLELCRVLRRNRPWCELISGGGVRGAEDLRALEQAGCHGALVATALHQGTWGGDDAVNA